MREILFRAQHIKPGEKVNLKGEPVPGMWVYGGILQGPGDHSIIYSTDPLNKYPVYTDTVGQFTGLTDKNGKKIFEGDILQDKHKQKYFVSYSDNISSFITQPLQNRSHALSTPCLNVGTMRYYEIFGNIHDNPELLEVTP